jgi:hypothetical protein
MKTTIVRGVMLFAAGAGCATVAQEWTSLERLEAADFQERLYTSLKDLEFLGQYVVFTRDGRIGIMSDPNACVPQPKPKRPGDAAEPRLVARAAEAAVHLNYALSAGEKEPVFLTDKCHTDDDN